MLFPTVALLLQLKQFPSLCESQNPTLRCSVITVCGIVCFHSKILAPLLRKITLKTTHACVKTEALVNYSPVSQNQPINQLSTAL